jgi:membrane-bound lytic murein transglycosylase B
LITASPKQFLMMHIMSLTRFLIPLLVLHSFIASPANALDTQREDVRAFIDEMVIKHGLKRSTVTATLRDAASKQSIIDTITRPAEQTLPWFAYRDRFLIARRIDKGALFAKQQSKNLERVHALGVAPEAVLGILGVETMYGEITGSYRVLDSLATLAFDYPPRAPFFRNELAEFLLLTREERINARAALGSYAGAIGAPQFMPSNYRSIAVDGDGNGKRDLWNSWPDIVMSVAQYLKKSGWREGEPIVASATVLPGDPARFDTEKLRLNETVGSLHAKGVLFETTLPDTAPALLIAVDGRDGVEYRVGFQNFYAISRYNPRVKYALAVNDLGEAITRAIQDASH